MDNEAVALAAAAGNGDPRTGLRAVAALRKLTACRLSEGDAAAWIRVVKAVGLEVLFGRLRRKAGPLSPGAGA